jgi:hypothetical protein
MARQGRPSGPSTSSFATSPEVIASRGHCLRCRRRASYGWRGDGSGRQPPQMNLPVPLRRGDAMKGGGEIGLGPTGRVSRRRGRNCIPQLGYFLPAGARVSRETQLGGTLAGDHRRHACSLSGSMAWPRRMRRTVCARWARPSRQPHRAVTGDSAGVMPERAPALVSRRLAGCTCRRPGRRGWRADMAQVRDTVGPAES